jgi:hypothetical protein
MSQRKISEPVGQLLLGFIGREGGIVFFYDMLGDAVRCAKLGEQIASLAVPRHAVWDVKEMLSVVVGDPHRATVRA